MLLNIFFQDLLSLFSFFLLHLLALKLEQFSLFVALRESQLLSLVFELHELAGMRRFLTGLRSEPLMKLLYF